MNNPLDDSVKNYLNTTTRHLKALKQMGISTLRDLLLYFPRAHELQEEVKIHNIVPGERQVLRGKISNFTTKQGQSRVSILSAILSDNTGAIEVIWFNQNYIKNQFPAGTNVLIAGKPKFDRGRFSMQNPTIEYEKTSKIHTVNIVPVYPEKDLDDAKISSKWLREKITPILYHTSGFEDPIPSYITTEKGFLNYGEAIKEIHLPTNEEKLKAAKQRLAFHELFILQCSALKSKVEWKRGAETKRISRNPTIEKQFLDNQSFQLTNAQKNAYEEIISDLNGSYPMLRLLQGDVGSGKTVVAMLCALQAVNAKYQVAVMAPTSILAKQHYQSFQKEFENAGIKIELLLGSLPSKDKSDIKENLENGDIDIIIGTHALIQDTVKFKNLGLCIVDEQHRFGVAQRERLKHFGSPHLLNMSATPIPRTLALTIYGDQDLSIIDEMPANRLPIITRIVPEKRRNDAYKWIKEQITLGRQAFIICPLVEESEFLENIKSAVEEYERLQNHIFPDLKIGLIHGRLDQEEKDAIMNQFSNNEIQIIVSTSVVEVGINVPNASIIVIESAERFGLSQLHQFRGRVGRGEHQSYCFLFPNALNEENQKRLTAMVRESSGFKLAEIDLELRGPGEVYGVKQSGIPDLKIANFTDLRIVKDARLEAEKIIAKDPDCKDYPQLAKLINTSNLNAFLA